jgi:hypothetical protein
MRISALRFLYKRTLKRKHLAFLADVQLRPLCLELRGPAAIPT